ncbi:class I SAM-dependent methyltransferase [Cryobacterium sp. PH29-G1]|uniref:SAM-dependent methyltransferase n=1 Tax=Cryobacterium sp. PH29-G1 TaxID=3046211 RepID=UPI0024B90FEF|nr:class I SAM-dependent methyltransferase [Cryobacterium sp. PH29-G1]MDJ0350185.1 class I SAM-dependent methyltransferase [Cryobacterium sp. PH29-G1]
MTTSDGHTHRHDGEPQADAATFWEGRYRESDRAWSGRANAALEREAADLVPGTALDLGSGEGGDALWLAQNGWSVTAVDIAPTALARGEATAVAAGLGDRIRWVAADLATWQPTGPFDLVTAHFLQSPVELPREIILRRAAATVAPGGVLLVVGHAQFPPWSKHTPDGVALPTADEVLASLELPAEHWTILTKAAISRTATGPDGQVVDLVDSVLTLRRTTAV